MLAHSPCCSHARPLASPLVSRPRLGAYRPCLPVLPQVTGPRRAHTDTGGCGGGIQLWLTFACSQAPHSHPQSRRCQLVAVAAKGKVQKDSLIDGRTVPADNPEARAFQKQTRGSPHKVCGPYHRRPGTEAMPMAASCVLMLHTAQRRLTSPSLQFRRALDAIRGRKYSTALIFMSYLPYRACEKVVTVLKSVRSLTIAAYLLLWLAPCCILCC